MASWTSEFDEDDIRELWENPPNVDLNLDSRIVVYLDQNAWGNLLEGSQDTSSVYRDAYNAVKRSTEELNYIYPYSIANLIETGAHLDEDFRARMYKLIFNLSKNYSLRNFFDVQQQEIYTYIFSKTPYLWELDARKEVIGKGVIYPHGDFRLKPEEWLSEEERDKIHRIFQSDMINKTIFDSEDIVEYITKKHPHKNQEYIENLEEIREGITPIESKESEQEKVDHVISSFKSMMLWELIRIGELFRTDIGSHIKNDIEMGGMLWFYAHFPAFYTYAHLSFARLSHTRREIEYNDLVDIMSLSVATPYCDTVVTEQFFGGMLHKYDIDRLHDTDIYFDIRKLADRVENELDG